MTAELNLRWRAIAEGLRAGRIIPFLGAGASSFVLTVADACPPSGTGLLTTLAAEAGLDVRCSGNCNHAIYDLPRVASYYQLVAESRRELDGRLRDLTGNPLFQPNSLYHLLARVAKHHPMLVVTTNYDALLEKAFDMIGAPYEVVATAADQLAYRGSDDSHDAADDRGKVYHRMAGNAAFEAVDPRDLAPDLLSRSLIYKVHGSVPNGGEWPGGYLIAEEDYIRFLGRMDRNHIYPFKIKTIGLNLLGNS